MWKTQKMAGNDMTQTTNGAGHDQKIKDAIECLLSIANADFSKLENGTEAIDDMDWREEALEMQRAAKCTLEAMGVLNVWIKCQEKTLVD